MSTTHTPINPDISPSRYIEKVNLETGDVIDEKILPKQLLVHNHRDYHIIDIQMRRLMSRVVRKTGDEEQARDKVREWRRRGFQLTDFFGKLIGRKNAEAFAKTVLGLKHQEYYFRFKPLPFTREQENGIVQALRQEAQAKMAAVTQNGRSALRVLLTGGTGFVGQEILWQAAHDDGIAEVVTLIRPKKIYDRKTGELIKTLSPTERGRALLRFLWLDTPEMHAKFRFIGGDIEEPLLGVSADDLAELQKTITHMIHCAASVSFEDPYEESFQVNVSGALNALDFSLHLQSTPDSPFVAHIGIETSYIHGRQVHHIASENEVVFPENFYNNYYELTKAMGSIETERFMLEHGLRVIQLCPAIVIGSYHTGNNRGDVKVVNAPINLFGRMGESQDEQHKGNWVERSKAALLTRMASTFPADPSAELNLIPVDWVVTGIISALHHPEIIGERVHLATDKRLTPQAMHDVVKEEFGVDIKLSDPTLNRNVVMPLLSRFLRAIGQERAASGLERLAGIFGGYSEWGQPVHEVGKDVRLLGLPDERPDTAKAFRMLCRHNRYVQHFGQVRDPDEISRRERLWTDFIADLEQRTGKLAADLSAPEFIAAMNAYLDPETFIRRDAPVESAAQPA